MEERNPFITANSIPSTEDELSQYMVPVFSSNNEETISHQQFIETVRNTAAFCFGDDPIDTEIRLSHQIKMRTLSGIGKRKEDLTDEDCGSYMQRAAFMLTMPATVTVGGEEHHLQVCGIRNYGDTNLLSSRGVQKFKIGIGLVNLVCTNMCLSVDGFSGEIATNDIPTLRNAVAQLYGKYDLGRHLEMLEMMRGITLNDKEVSTVLGRLLEYSTMESIERKALGVIDDINTTQVIDAARRITTAPYRTKTTVWQLYNTFTENKNHYIHNFLEKEIALTQMFGGIAESMAGESNDYDWFYN